MATAKSGVASQRQKPIARRHAIFNHRKTAATVTVVNSLGEKVKDIFTGMLNEGTTQFTVSGEGLSAGIYFVRVTAGETVSAKKFIFMK